MRKFQKWLTMSLCVLCSPLAIAAPMSDGSILYDDFSGSTLDTTSWNVLADNAPVVSGGNVTLDNFNAGSTSSIRTNDGILDLTSSPSDYVVETVFVFRDIDTRTDNKRQVSVLTGLASDFGVTSNPWEAVGFDVRLRKTYGTTYLTWHGFDSTDLNEIGAGMSAINANQYYKLTLHVRNIDGQVDVYLDDSLISTRTLIEGVGSENLGQIYPDRILVGSATNNAKADLSLEYITVGVPEPGSLGLLGAGVMCLVLRRRG